jgi:hypothetical protein
MEENVKKSPKYGKAEAKIFLLPFRATLTIPKSCQKISTPPPSNNMRSRVVKSINLL